MSSRVLEATAPARSAGRASSSIAPTRGLGVDRGLVAIAIIATCVLFTPAAADPVNIVKLSVLLVLALALVASVVVRAVRDRVVHLPLGPASWVTAVLTVALLISTAVAPVTHTAMLGTYGRNSGLLAYLAAIVLLLVGLRIFDAPHARVLLGGVVAAGLFTATYGLLQKAGIDAIPWNNPFNPIIAGLGNPNFASGYLGVAAAAGVGGALWAGWAVGWRVACAVTAVLCLVTAALSNSVQGPIAAAGGIFVIVMAFLLNQRQTVRRLGIAVLGGGTAIVVAIMGYGLVTEGGPAASIFDDQGSVSRRFYWSAALDMFGGHPVLGVGLDQYGNFWRTARSPGSVAFLGGPSFSDAAHSVPLQILAQGGIVLGLAYAALLGLTAFVLVRGLLRLRGADRMLLAAVGGAWTAYQVQSFVSIDQVPLIVLHFALAGGVLALGGAAGLRAVRLPGALQPVQGHANDARARRRAAAAALPHHRSLSGADTAVVAVVGLVALVGAWFAFVPLRASIAAKSGMTAMSQGDGTAALADYQRAAQLEPGEPSYIIDAGTLYERLQPPMTDKARAAYEQAVAVNPYEVNALRAAASLAEKGGDLAAARSMFTRAVTLDPYNSNTLVPAATFELRHGGAVAAKQLLDFALTRMPAPGTVAPVEKAGQASIHATLGDARAVTGDASGARAAYQQALTLDPTSTVAKNGLSKLAAG